MEAWVRASFCSQETSADVNNTVRSQKISTGVDDLHIKLERVTKWSQRF